MPFRDNSTRIEGLSDGVFALAIALLLISSKVPENFDELLVFVYDLVPFAICIIFIYWIWNAQVAFFKNYNLRDRKVVLLNLALLFLVLFYVYPLKFLMTWLTKYFSSLFGYFFIDSDYFNQQIRGLNAIIPFGQLPWLMVIYGLGFVSVFMVFLLLYRHVHTQREVLALSERDRLDIRFSIKSYQIIVGVGVLSVVLALGLQWWSLGLAGFVSGVVYNLLWVFSIINGRRYRKAVQGLNEKMQA